MLLAIFPSVRVGVDRGHLIWQGRWKMIRKKSRLGMVAGVLWLVTSGCEPHSSWLRHNDDDDMMAKAADSDDSSSSKKVIGSSSSDATDSTSFFQNSRLSGGLSSEARSIEKDLGVGN